MNFTDNDITIDISNFDEKMTMTVEKIDENTVQVKTTTETGKTYSLTYNNTQNYFELNGERGEIYLEEFYDENEALIANSANLSARYVPTPEGGATSIVYVSTSNLHFSKNVNSLGALVTVVGGILGAAFLTEFSIAKSDISGKISAWLSVIGMAVYFSTVKSDGYWQYSTYRSKNKVNTG
ncbi:hypothetical protein V7146_16310 [Gottfriedia acidiceleris]|uniref:hypothetical protein n=1 Tax=Gottfriedia acidiceleris TaxID=371036 RepID=UPI002FFDBCFB